MTQNSVDFCKILNFSIRIYKHLLCGLFHMKTCNFDHVHISFVFWALPSVLICVLRVWVSLVFSLNFSDCLNCDFYFFSFTILSRQLWEFFFWLSCCTSCIIYVHFSLFVSPSCFFCSLWLVLANLSNSPSIHRSGKSFLRVTQNGHVLFRDDVINIWIW